jgi:hypothetical protein
MADASADRPQKFEALKSAARDLVHFLRFFAQVDFALLSAYMTVQFVLGGWLLQTAQMPLRTKIQVLIVDLLVAGVAANLLILIHRRCKREAKKLDHLIDAVRTSASGLCGSVASRSSRERPSGYMLPTQSGYLLAISGALLGILFILAAIPSS